MQDLNGFVVHKTPHKKSQPTSLQRQLGHATQREIQSNSFRVQSSQQQNNVTADDSSSDRGQHRFAPHQSPQGTVAHDRPQRHPGYSSQIGPGL